MKPVFVTNNLQKEIRWIHKRGPSGDVEVYATTKKNAIAVFKHYGFTQADETNVTPGRSKFPVPASDL